MVRLLVEKETSVWTVRFHNPPHGYMDQHTAAQLLALLDELAEAPEVRAVILTGDHEGVFIRHYDVGELQSSGSAMVKRGLSFSAGRPVPETDVHRCLARMETSPVVFIAAINGMALGGGLEMALATDIRLVQDGPYELGLPEVKVGLLPGAGGTQRLTRLLGPGRALPLILLGQTLSPRRAVEAGLAHECIAGDVVARARELATQLAGQSARANAHIKRLVRSVGELPADEGLALERTLFCDLMVSPESQDAMTAMLEGGLDIREVGG